MSPREQFLRELDDRLIFEGVDAELRRALVDESALHLDAGIEARIETGDPEPQAVRDAVTAFGSAKQYASAMAEALLPDRKVLLKPVRLLAALTMGTMIVAMLSGTMSIVKPATVLAVVFGMGLAASCFRARRVDAIGLAGIGAFSTILLWLGMGLLWLHPGQHGGLGYVPVWEVASERAESQRGMQGAVIQAKRIRMAAQAFSLPGTDPLVAARTSGMESNGSILIVRHVNARLDPNQWYEAVSPAVADSFWPYHGETMARAADDAAQYHRNQLMGLDRAASSPFLVRLKNMAEVAVPMLPFYVLTLWALGLAGAGVGQAVRLSRWVRRRGRRV